MKLKANFLLPNTLSLVLNFFNLFIIKKEAIKNLFLIIY